MNPGAALATRQSSFSKGRLPLAPRSASSPLLTWPNGIGQAAAPSRLGAPQAASGCGNAEDLLTGYAEEVAAPIVYEPRQTTRVPDGAARRESARKMFAPVEVYTGFNSDSDDDCTAPAAAAARKASNSMIVQSVHAAVRETISKAEAAAQGEVAKRRADAWDMLFEDAPAAKPASNGNRAAKPAGSVRKVERRVMQPVAARSAVAVSDGPAKAGNLVSYGGGYKEETFAPRMRSAQPVQAESTTQASRRTRFATTFAPVEVYTGFTEDD